MQLQSIEYDEKNLKPRSNISLREIFASKEINKEWNYVKDRLDMFAIPDGTGGVNPGDRRAIFYLINKFKPFSVLEIGTHIGASTLYFASALFMNLVSKDGKHATLVSVDIADVNDPISKPWLKHGINHSPAEMIMKMNLESYVEFVTASSLEYFARCYKKFDFIFLDGDHAANTVYKEIPAALGLLSEGGIILLHDYFPNLKPLWSNASVIPGPYLATERLKEEGANIVVLPLGELPWTTKYQSNISSLALLSQIK